MRASNLFFINSIILAFLLPDIVARFSKTDIKYSILTYINNVPCNQLNSEYATLPNVSS